jgi:integrase
VCGSRTRDEDNTPKSARNHRTIQLLPNVLDILPAMPAPLHLGPETFVFQTRIGLPVDRDRFVEQRWQRALRATAIRPRKFYAIRHTFMSTALSRGANIKWLADYCGTPVEMIERHYARWLHDDGSQLALLEAPKPAARAASGGRREDRNVQPDVQPFLAWREPRGKSERRGGDSNSRGL